MWTSTPQLLLETLVAGTTAYLALVLILRTSGKRTLSKWNAFDFVVTIALGSSLATIILSQDVSLLQGVLVLALLVVLQLIVTFLAVRIDWFDEFIKARPTLLLCEGEVLHEALRRERVSEAELYSALRGHGISSLEEAYAAVLETDGSFSVLKNPPEGEHPTLRDVRGFKT